MQIPLRSLGPDWVQQIRDSLRRLRAMHGPADGPVTARSQDRVELPQPEALAWEDTEIDIRRVVL